MVTIKLRIIPLNFHCLLAFGEKVNAILYERRKAIRERDKKKAKNLKIDLNELGIIIKDRNED